MAPLLVLLVLSIFQALAPLVGALEPYHGTVPPIVSLRKPFGFASGSTGGSGVNSTTYLVTNATDLRTALKLPIPKTIYVKGTIYGNQLDNGTFADCQW